MLVYLRDGLARRIGGTHMLVCSGEIVKAPICLCEMVKAPICLFAVAR